MSPYWRGPLDARRLGLVALPTHQCTTCRAPVEVQRVNATTLGQAAQRLQTFLWGRHFGCPCGNTTRPEPMVGEDFLTHGRLDASWW